MLSVFRRLTPVAARTMSRCNLGAPVAVRSFSAPVGANTEGDYQGLPQPLPNVEYWTQGFSFNGKVFCLATFLISISLMPWWTVPLVWRRHNAIAEMNKEEIGPTRYGPNSGAVFGN